MLALSLLAIDPIGLRGLWLRARSGPARERFQQHLDAIALPQRRLHPAITDDQLYGGLDLGATLGAGRAVLAHGILSDPAALVLTMAERCPGGLAARLGQALDGSTQCLIALDEGAQEDETLPPGLADRLGLFISLDEVALAALDHGPDLAAIATARARLGKVTIDDDDQDELVILAARLGITSLRAPLLASAAARAHAALFGRNSVVSDDLIASVELVYAHRGMLDEALQEAPQPEADDPQPDREPPPEAERDAGEEQQPRLPDEILLEAVAAALPPDLLASLAAGRSARQIQSASGSGARHRGNRRGRPLPSRPGRLGSDARIDLVATLRVAAPWQTMRRAAGNGAQLVHIRPSDIRIRQFEETSDRLLVFAVDASGSAAMARLGEAKGAIEILLSEAYARRDHVALIAFRGTEAELLLPPTRSLVQTRRRLALLPGGGGTPLAAGLKAGFELSRQARARGMTPTLALLTDGRGNIALDGTASREMAAQDASHVARTLRSDAITTLVIDTSQRPQAALQALAAELDGRYIALPRADSRKLSAAVSAVLDA